MELVVHRAIRLAVKQNGLALTSKSGSGGDSDEQMEYDAIKSIISVINVSNVVISATTTAATWDDAATEWTVGDNFDFLLHSAN
jgi:hypothetical protein